MGKYHVMAPYWQIGDHSKDLPPKWFQKLNNNALSDYFGLLTAGPGGPGGPTLSCVHVQAFGRAGHFASSLWNVEKITCL